MAEPHPPGAGDDQAGDTDGAGPGVYFMRTERLGFRPWSPDDLPLAARLWGDPEVGRFIFADAPISPEVVRSRLRQEMAWQREHGIQYWPLFLLATGAHIGCCGLRPYAPDEAMLEAGVQIGREYWRRGFASEAMTRVIRWAFDEFAIAALFAGHHPENTASRRLLKRLGFVFTHLEYYPPTGQEHPSYRLSRAAAGRPGPRSSAPES